MPHTHAIGDKVRVTDGPFHGHNAIIREIAGDRLKLDVTAKPLTVPITVHPHQVERTGTSAR
jgi:transcription antitermination factor NusG